MKSGNTISLNKITPLKLTFGASALLAALYLMRGFYQLIGGANLPVDLAHRWWRFQYLIIENQNIYDNGIGAVYPPSSYVLMGPFLGWTPYEFTAEFWGLVNVVSLIAICYITYRFVKEAGYSNSWAYSTIPLILSIHSISMGLGVGQITVFYVACMAITLYMGLREPFGNIWSTVLGCISLAIAMGKFSLIIPFCLIMLIDQRFRTMLLSAVGLNLLLSWGIAYRLDTSLVTLVFDLFENTQTVIGFGSIDLHNLIHLLGLDPKLSGPASLVMLLLYGAYLFYTYQEKNLFYHLALAALVTRFWTYHANYDNLILIFLLLYLFRTVRASNFSNWTDIWKMESLWLLNIWFSLALPARVLTIDAPYWGLFLAYQVIVWLGSGIFLLYRNAESDNQHKVITTSK